MGNSVAIIGAGPAGIAAAIQLKRQSVPFTIFEQNEVGGLLRNANWIENYPGFPKGISGLNLIEQFQKHLNQWQIQVKTESVEAHKMHFEFFSIDEKTADIVNLTKREGHKA